MPPSPSLRCSPQKELRIENDYKRRHRVEGGLPVKTKDDNLVLFNEMQLQERDNFLLHSTGDLEDSLSKLKYFPDLKLNILVRGESSDLLNVDNEKNDYDWLLTPPDTPLFPSLDDDEPTLVNPVSRSGHPSEPIMISKPFMAEKTHRTSRSSISPCRLGLSPRSAGSTPQLGGRPSYTHHSSPTRDLQPTTPSRMPASPPCKFSTPTSRSSTPTLRKMSPGSSGSIPFSARKGTSPVKATRANSASPKLRGRQLNFPGFSSENPPNLQTSLSDQPASHDGGPSLAYRKRGDSFFRSERLPLSLKASESVSSSHSHDKGNFKSHSKGSIASSGDDDDADSLFSVITGMPTSPVLRKNGAFANSRNMRFSKQRSRTLSASFAPRSSFDSAFQQMDQHRSPQNMFRPLLSSVPASTFYTGKGNTTHRPMFSWNSSLTTSSNTSSELGANIPPENEINKHDQDDIAGEWAKMLNTDTQEEIFAFDKMEEIEDIGNEIRTGKPQNVHGSFDGSVERMMAPEELEHLTSDLDKPITSPTSEFSYAASDHSQVDSIAITMICCKCNKSFQIFEITDRYIGICSQCTKKDKHISYGMSAGLPERMLHVSDKPHCHPNMVILVDGSCEKSQIGLTVPEVAEETASPNFVVEHQSNADMGHDCLPGIFPIKLVPAEWEQHLPAEEIECQPEVASTLYNGDNNFQRLHSFSTNQNLKIDDPEGAGISLILKRPGSGPIVWGRSLAAASMFYAESSYTRENVNALNALNVSVTGDNSSASPFVEQGSSGQSEACTHPQLSSTKTGMDCVRSEPGLNSKSTEAFLPDTSDYLLEDLAQTKLLHTKDNLNALKVCVTWESSSASSPTDLGSLVQTEANIHRDSSCSNNDMQCVRIDLRLKKESTQMFVSEASSNSCEDLSPAHMIRTEEKVGGFAKVLLHNTHGEVIKEHAQSPEKTESCVMHSSSIKDFLPMGGEILHSESCVVLDSPPMSVDVTQCALVVNVSTSETANDVHHASCVNSESDISQNNSATQEVMPDTISESHQVKEDGIINNSPCNTGISETPLESLSGATSVLENGHDNLQGPQTESDASKSTSNIVEAHSDSLSSILVEDVLMSGVETNKHVDDIHGELAITVEGPWGNKSKCLTLEEATDTIIFCSSIIHDLAIKAAAIAMEKECSSTEEAYRPTFITLGKSAFDEKDQRKAPSRHTTKPPKARKKSEMDSSLPVAEPENKVKIDEFPTLSAEFPNKAGSVKPVKLESKCNCTVM